MSALVDALLSATLLSAGPEHGHAPPGGAVAGPATAVLLALPFVAGFALLRPFVPAPGRGSRELLATATAGAVLWEVFRLPADAPRPLVAALVALALLVPLAVTLSRSTSARTDAVQSWLFAAAAATAAVAFQHARGPAGVAVLCGMTALAWYPLCATRSRGGTVVLRTAAAVLALALIGGVAQAVIVGTGGPKPGVPVLARITTGTTTLDVVVVPHLPGPNLVHVTPARGLLITSAADSATTATRPGTTGEWAVIDLPEGQSTLRFGAGTVPVDTGDAVPGAPDLTGADGPECASALLGGLVGEPAARRGTSTCPAEALTTPDAEALRVVPAFLAGRGQRTISLVADDSPRSAAAARTVRESAEARGIRVVDDPTAPVVVVSGWEAAAATVAAIAAGDHPAQGSYLAPWLLTPPLLEPPAGQVVPLTFTPTDESPMRYVAALTDRAPGAAPSTSGYRAWLRARGDHPAATVRLHAAGTAAVPGTGHHDHRPSWLHGGIVIPVTGPLDPG
ncbi:DUF6239 family natural product biosynthesis protein [Saccharothrix sp. NRRL B-16314]|uniref:DUF6239 family natural product biosynthesis protein n=1 Tax=Saccharothrix sp. NRRL B-16314 TaxID=1463825 RepID=UPI00068BB8D0|nr:DUF6239 family natural product biosynthesis protein [Saccharothrix sp. NRRL B-16314]